jgi:Zn-dependent protease
MQTLHGIRFLPVGRIDGMQLGLDARWLDVRGLALLALLTLAALAGQLGQFAGSPFWARLSMACLIVPAIVLTSLGHELGHVVASRLAGLTVRAVVLAPQGGVTIHAGSEQPVVNFLTALAGPMANAIGGLGCMWLVVARQPEGGMLSFVLELAALQLLTAAANLVPLGPMDGHRMLTAWRAASAIRPRRLATAGQILPVV